MAEIRSLPEDVAAQIKSSVIITSLNEVALGLLKNSLDAGSRRVDIDLDYGRGSCSAEDDGSGIAPADFEASGGLGKPYHTSRLEGEARCHGAHGVFLASVSALSILTVTSRHRLHGSTHALMFHHSRPVARFLPAPAHLLLRYRSHGTRVSVQDLFGNMPVRVRQRPSEADRARVRGRDWDALCKGATGILLAWPQAVSVSMKCIDLDQHFRVKYPVMPANGAEISPGRSLKSKAFDVAQVSTVLGQGLGISPGGLSKWVKASARALHMTVRGLISLEPAPSKASQFLCVGVRYLENDSIWSTLYDEVNRLFEHSSFGRMEELENGDFEDASPQKDRRYKRSGLTQRQLRGGSKGIDRWPMFFIRVDIDGSGPPQNRRFLKSPESSHILSCITQVLKAMVSGFLSQYHFRPQAHGLRTGIKSPHQGELIERDRPIAFGSMDLPT